MDRKEFLKHAGLATGSLMLIGNGCDCFSQGAQGPPVTPCEKKQNFTQTWVKRFFDLLDANIDEATLKKLMRANGKACNQQSMKGQKIEPIPLDEFVLLMQKILGKDNCRREGNLIYYSFVKNPEGLKVEDGFCLCPMVESGPPGLSGTFCECSVGYVQNMFETYTGKSVRVELMESLKRGGKGCRFKIFTT